MPNPHLPGQPDEALRFVRELFTETQTQCQGLMSEAKLPEAFKAPISTLKAKVDAALAALADRPTDQVPAAQEASYALRNMVQCLSYMNEIVNGTVEQLNKMVAEFSPKVEQLNELQGRLEKKDLLTREEAQAGTDAAVTSAVEAAVKGERDRQALLSTRRTQLCEAKLPVPAEDNLVEGDDKAFESFRKTSADRLALLTEAGLTEQLQEAGELADTLYGSQKQFDRTLKLARLARPGAAAPDPLAAVAPAPPAAPAADKPKLKFAI